MTLAVLFKGAKNCTAFHEPFPRLFELGRAAYQGGNEPALEAALVAGWRLAREKLQSTVWAVDSVYVETSPQVTFLAPVIAATQQDAIFIHLIRSPRAVVRSGMRRGWYAGHKADRNRITPRKDDPFFDDWSSWSPLRKNWWLWAETNRWIANQEHHIQTHFVRSEQLFAGDYDTLDRLFAFCGLPVPEPRRVSQVLSKPRNVQVQGAFHAESDLRVALGGNLFAFVEETAARFGYLDSLREAA